MTEGTRTERDRSVPSPAAGLVLASGLSRRFGGGNKLLAPLAGVPVVRRTVMAYRDAGLRPVIVVVGHQGNEVTAALDGLDLEVVVNPNYEAGQSRALVLGVSRLPPETQVAVIGVGDQPFLDPGVIGDLLQALRCTGAPIAVPRYAGLRGNPVAFRRELFGELLGVQGDVGGRAVVERHMESVAWIDAPDERSGVDIDTLEDYQALAGE